MRVNICGVFITPLFAPSGLVVVLGNRIELSHVGIFALSGTAGRPQLIGYQSETQLQIKRLHFKAVAWADTVVHQPIVARRSACGDQLVLLGRLPDWAATRRPNAPSRPVRSSFYESLQCSGQGGGICEREGGKNLLLGSLYCLERISKLFAAGRRYLE